MRKIDARGKPCPQPVLLTKAATDRGTAQFEVVVDNEGAAQNVLRFIGNTGYKGEILAEGTTWTVRAGREGGEPAAVAVAAAPSPEATVDTAEQSVLRTLIIQSEHLGAGDKELGARLLAQFLSTLAVNDKRPERIVLMNTGARLACSGSPVLEALQDIAGKGVPILVCGTCLNHFGLNKELAVGRPTDAYEVLNLTLEGGVTTWS